VASFLDTVQDYIDRARVLLQDGTSPYRYSDDELMQGLNMAVLEARRIRPDMFVETDDADLPYFTAVGNSTTAIDVQFRSAFLYYVVGHAQLRDEEDTQDARSVALLSKFTAQLLTVGA
jgi:hypothetical protein